MHLSLSGIDGLLRAIRAEPGVEGAVPRIRASVLVDGAATNKPGMLLGLDLAAEGPYLSPASMIGEGRVPQAGRPEVMVGDELAAELGLAVGDTLTLLGQTAYRALGGIRLAVVGLAHSGIGAIDRTLLLTPLDQAQQLAALDDAATEILVYAVDPDRADELTAALAARLQGNEPAVEVKSWKAQGTFVGLVDVGKKIYTMLLGLMLLMAGLVIVNTMLMTVLERTREIGMQAALGMRPRDTLRLVVTEGLIIGLIGGAIGAVLGSAITIVLGRVGIDFSQAARTVDMPFQGVIRPVWSVLPSLLMLVAGVNAAGVAALYPAWLAVKLRPAEALRG
jgi:putative ABC transport system permease protein